MSCVITSEEKTNISREGACETSRSSKIVVFYICVIYTNLSVWKVGKNSKYPILITCIDLCQTEQGGADTGPVRPGFPSAGRQV